MERNSETADIKAIDENREQIIEIGEKILKILNLVLRRIKLPLWLRMF